MDTTCAAHVSNTSARVNAIILYIARVSNVLLYIARVSNAILYIARVSNVSIGY